WGGWGLFGGWGWGLGWFHHSVFLNPGFFHRYGFGGFHGGTVWAHDAFHRGGIAYPNRGLAARFNNTSVLAAPSNFARTAPSTYAHGYPSTMNRTAPGNTARNFAGNERGFAGNQRFANQGARQNFSAPAQRAPMMQQQQRFSA